MKFSRRDFVKIGGIAAITSIGLSSSAFSKSADNLEFQTSNDFSKLIDTNFFISNNNVSITANEDTYQVFHPELGKFDLFLAEGRNGKKRVLLATVNRI